MTNPNCECLFSVFYDLLVQSAAKLRSATDFKEIISSYPVPKLDDEVHIKPLGDASSRLMVNVEPNRSSIDVYEDLCKRN